MAGRASPTGILGLVGLGLRRLRIDLSVVVVLAVAVAVTAFGVAALPRFISTTSDRALSSAAEEASAFQRNVTFLQADRLLPTSDGPFTRVENRGADLASEIGEHLGSTISGSTYVITTPNLELRPLPAEPQAPLNRWFFFRIHAGIEPEMSVVEGTLPEPSEPMEILAGPCDEGGDADCETVELPVFQTALTRETADGLRVDVGDLVHLSPDVTTQLNARLPLSQLDYELILEISGIVELSDPDRDIWNGDQFLHQPVIAVDPIAGERVFGFGLLADDDYGRLLTAISPSRFSYEWANFVDYGQIDSDNIGTIGDELQELSLLYETQSGLESPSFFTGLDDLASEFDTERDTVVSFLSMVFVGVLGVLIATIVVLAALAAKRSEQSTILIRGRGADRPRLTLARLTEALLMFVPATAIGLVSARLVVPGRDDAYTLINTLLVALGLALVFTVMALPSIAGELGGLLSRRVNRVAQARRVVIEVLIVALAVGAAVLVVRRGIDPEASGFDPLLGAIPLLIGLANGVVLLRLAPTGARLASTVGSRAKGVVGMIGFREMAARPLVARLPSLVILLGVAIGVFALVQLDSIQKAQVVGSWQTVGANYRVEPTLQSSTLSPQLVLDVGTHDVTATADATVLDGQVADDGVFRGNIQVLAVDLSDYEAVADGTPADPDIPSAMFYPIEASSSEDVASIPAITSESWPIRRPASGDVVEIDVNQVGVDIVITAVRDSFPGLDLDRPFIVVDRAALASVSDRIDVLPTRRYISAPDSVSADLEEDVIAQARSARLVSRPDLLESIAGTPTMTAIDLINTLALGLVAVLAVVAAISGFALTSAERTRDLGYMRAIGLTRRQMTWATITEQLPPAILAALLGLTAGIGLAVLMEASLDTTSLTGTTLATGIVVDWVTIVAAALAILASVVVAPAIYSFARKDLDLADVLRKGERV